ncbi:hypothetical protein KAU37_13465 [Candidatus Bipolaricaulota bacterium]|nr:hypothetical protein [Candidatus Bipolaricaulota bacterium]
MRVFLTRDATSSLERESEVLERIRQRLLEAPFEQLMQIDELGLPREAGTPQVVFGARLRIVAHPHPPHVFSGWIYSNVDAALDPTKNTVVAVLREGEAHKLTQFALENAEEVIVAWGDEAKDAILAVLEAALSFDPSKFDRDGYWVE